MRNRRLALAAALLLAITSADGAALAVSGADFSSEEVAEAVFDEVENEGLDNRDEVRGTGSDSGDGSGGGSAVRGFILRCAWHGSSCRMAE
ncbi:MAG: hypothetical protein ACLSGK_14935 [Lachnospiraceae bacterium]